MSQHIALSNTELKTLNTLLLEEGGMSVFSAHGFLAGLQCLPQFPPLEAWFPALWGEDRPFKDWNEMNTLFANLNRLTQTISQAFNQKTLQPLLDCQQSGLSAYTELTPEQEENLMSWCFGFITGMGSDPSVWAENESEELMASIAAITVLSTRSQEFQNFTDEDFEDEDLEDEDFEDEDLEDEDLEDEDLEDEDLEDEDLEDEDFDDLFTEDLGPEQLTELTAAIPTFIAIIYAEKKTPVLEAA